MTDWDAAYDNRKHVGDAEDIIACWAGLAADYRRSVADSNTAKFDITYGGKPREKFDLLVPENPPNGLVIFIHGGYWRALDKSCWSHFAPAFLSRQRALCIVGYSLAPDVKIRDITKQVSAAIIKAAGIIDGPIHLVGHSAGGHLVTRMMCSDSTFPDNVASRVKHVVSISGLFDLRQLLKTELNNTLRLDEEEAIAESPALQKPKLDCSLTCWVGGDELPEFLRQNELLTDSWNLPEDKYKTVCEPGKNHFTVVDTLADPQSALVKEVLKLP